MTDSVNYRLALILPQSRKLLAEYIAGTYHLVQLNVPKWERCAEQLTRLIEERWQLQSVVLDVVIDDCLDSP